jgi:hypothetical protein
VCAKKAAAEDTDPPWTLLLDEIKSMKSQVYYLQSELNDQKEQMKGLAVANREGTSNLLPSEVPNKRPMNCGESDKEAKVPKAGAKYVLNFF